MTNLQNILLQLSKYKGSVFEMCEGANTNEINSLEKQLGYSLPKDFREFLSLTNGASILFENIYGIYGNNNKPFDLYRNYLREKDEVGNPIRKYLLPIYPNGYGDHYCLDLKSLYPDNETCNVIFWQHDYLYSNDEMPDIEAFSFTEFLKKLLIEISDDFNYDGTEKEEQ